MTSRRGYTIIAPKQQQIKTTTETNMLLQSYLEVRSHEEIMKKMTKMYEVEENHDIILLVLHKLQPRAERFKRLTLVSEHVYLDWPHLEVHTLFERWRDVLVRNLTVFFLEKCFVSFSFWGVVGNLRNMCFLTHISPLRFQNRPSLCSCR